MCKIVPGYKCINNKVINALFSEPYYLSVCDKVTDKDVLTSQKPGLIKTYRLPTNQFLFESDGSGVPKHPKVGLNG